jgi:cell shape-determining protein MreC
VLEILARAIRHEKEIKGILNRKETIQIISVVGNMILYLKDPKHPTRRLLSLIKEIFQQNSRTQSYHKQNQQSTKIISFSTHQEQTC